MIYYNTSLHLREWEFQRNALYFAELAFREKQGDD